VKILLDQNSLEYIITPIRLIPEIRENLMKYAEWLVEVDARIKKDKASLTK